MTKFKNLNYITLFAMLMIVNIHYFNHFSGEVSPGLETNIMLIIRGFTLPAVVVYLTNTAFTSLYLDKKINYRSLYLFIIIPTLLFTQFQHYAFGLEPVTYDMRNGFSDSWFGEMYLYVMLLIPLIMHLNRKSVFTRNLMLVYSIIAVLSGFYISVTLWSSTITNIGIPMMFPYAGLIYLLYRIIEFVVTHVDETNIKIVRIISAVAIILTTIFEALCFNDFFTNGTIGRSYFSPVAIILAMSIWVLIYTADLSKLPEVRSITRSSYFFFFTHWIVIRFWENYYPSLPTNHVWLGLVVTIIFAYILAIITFVVYDFIIKSLKL